MNCCDVGDEDEGDEDDKDDDDQVFTGKPLFSVPSGDRLLESIVQLLGPPPDSLLSQRLRQSSV